MKAKGLYEVWESYTMVREKPLEGCQYKLDNGEKCGQKIDGQGAWLYCSECRDAAQKQAKKQRDREHSAKRREGEAHRAEDNFYHFLYYHGLTEPKLRPFCDRAAALREYYPSSKDDCYQQTLNSLHQIRERLLNPPDNLPRVASDAKVEIETLLTSLEQKQDSQHDPILNRLIVCGMELQRDVGQQAFTEIGRAAKRVRELCRQEGELLPLAHALFVEVELCRLAFLARPHHRQLLRKAQIRLDAAGDLCERALRHSTGERKQMAGLLAFHVPSLQGALACAGEEPDQAERSIQALEEWAKAGADYGANPISETIRFSCLIHQAGFSLHCDKTASAEKQLKEAEQISMQWGSIEAQLELASVKAALALATHSPTRQQDVQEYVLLFQRHPFLSHYHHLRALNRRYPKDVDVFVFTGFPIYFDTMFRRLHPFLLSV